MQLHQIVFFSLSDQPPGPVTREMKIPDTGFRDLSTHLAIVRRDDRAAAGTCVWLAAGATDLQKGFRLSLVVGPVRTAALGRGNVGLRPRCGSQSWYSATRGDLLLVVQNGEI
jgi:hypothetical protein